MVGCRSIGNCSIPRPTVFPSATPQLNPSTSGKTEHAFHNQHALLRITCIRSKCIYNDPGRHRETHSSLLKRLFVTLSKHESRRRLE